MFSYIGSHGFEIYCFYIYVSIIAKGKCQSMAFSYICILLDEPGRGLGVAAGRSNMVLVRAGLVGNMSGMVDAATVPDKDELGGIALSYSSQAPPSGSWAAWPMGDGPT